MECAGDDPREQRRLDEDEQRRRDAERDVGAEQHADGPRAAYEARVERAHGLVMGGVAGHAVPEDVVRPAPGRAARPAATISATTVITTSV